MPVIIKIIIIIIIILDNDYLWRFGVWYLLAELVVDPPEAIASFHHHHHHHKYLP